MVYFQPQSIEASFANQALASDRRRPVEIFYNGTGLHQIAGPVPVIDFSTSANRSSAGNIESYTTKVTIDGKIVRTGIDGDILQNGTGIGPVLSGIEEFKNFFGKDSQDFGTLEVKCGVTTTIFKASPVKFLDISFNKSDDNWVYTADYSINMEYEEPAPGNKNFPAKNTNDSWTIEPLEDYIFTEYLLKSNQKSEIHNPQLLPQAATEDSPVPGVYGGSGPVGNSEVKITNIPQYRISRRVSAVGIPTGSGNFVGNSCYQNAKLWVEDRLFNTFRNDSLGYDVENTGIAISGLPYFSFADFSQGPNRSIHLYNHLRTHNFSVTDGTYEVNDTWLAMPSGISYIEDYSIESSTDDRFIKTVRVQGQIRGLSMHNFAAQSGDSLYNPPNQSGMVHVSGGLYERSSNMTTSYNVPDLNYSNSSKIKNIENSKYQNALSGWLYDIKPYVYRRASIAVNSSDRDRDYINKTNPLAKPGNPFYSKESLLNINPTSTTEGFDPRKGTISYSVEYTNKLTLITGVISENISINETGPTDVFGESFIIGRRLGPIIQSLNSKTSTRKDVSIDITVLPPSSIQGILMTSKECPLYISGSLYKQIDTVIEALRPFGAHDASMFGNTMRPRQPGQAFVSQDNHSWNPAEGRYSRNVSWTYQQCQNYKNYLDH